MSIDQALRELRCATAAQIRHRAQSSLEDTYKRLVELEAEGKAYIRVTYRGRMIIDRTWWWKQ